MKTRISKASLSHFPKPIADKIRELQTRFRLASFSYETHPAPYAHYFGEGDKITIFYGEKETSIEMVSSDLVGASGVSYEVGARVPMKPGTTILEVSYLGKYFLSIINISETAIEGAAA